MLHQFIQSYNILTVIFHFSHHSICFPTWYQQSNGGGRKNCLARTPSKYYLSESLMCSAQTKATSRRPRLTDPLDGAHYEGEQECIPANLGYLKLFMLQFWQCRCNFTQQGNVSSPATTTAPSHHLAICRLASSRSPLQTASPLCSMLLVSTGAQKYLHKEP